MKGSPPTLPSELKTMQPKSIKNHISSRWVRGFTLIELTLVVGLVALMLGAAIPLFQGALQKKRGEGILQEVVYALRFANQKSVFERQNHDVVFDFRHRRYWLEFLKEGKYSKVLKKRAAQIQDLPKQFEFIMVYFPDKDEIQKREKTRIPFYPDGTAREAVILLGKVDFSGGRDDYEQYYAIEVRGSDGRVRILEGEEKNKYVDFL